jgi:ribosome-associated protein
MIKEKNSQAPRGPESEGAVSAPDLHPFDLGPARSGLEVTRDGDADLPFDLIARMAGLRPSITTPEGGPLTLATTGQLILPSLDRACLCARVASDNKARDIVVLDMRKITPLYDFFVLSTGSSRRQIHTITEETDAALRDVGDRRLSIEGYEASSWVVQDYGDVMVHVFTPQTREYYALEDLWADAPHVDWEKFESTQPEFASE